MTSVLLIIMHFVPIVLFYKQDGERVMCWKERYILIIMSMTHFSKTTMRP